MKRGAALVSGFVLATGVARADGGPAVTIDPCVPADGEEVRRIVAVELGGRATASLQIRVSCTARGARILVRDGDVRRVRSLDLAAAPERARERLLALAIAELVSAQGELESDADAPRPAVVREFAASSVTPEPMPTEPAAPEPRSLRVLGVLAHRSVFADAGLASWGLGARLATASDGGLGVAFDLVADRATKDTALGAVTFDTASASGAVTSTWVARGVGVGLSAGARVGVAHARGEPTSAERAQGSDVTAAWGGPFAAASLFARLGARFLVELVGEGGWVLTPVTGTLDAGSNVSLRGGWLGAQLGAGIFF